MDVIRKRPDIGSPTNCVATDSRLISALLGLENIEVTDVRLTSNKKLLIRVKSTKEKTPCRICGGETKPHGCGRTLELRHLPTLGHETIIETRYKT